MGSSCLNFSCVVAVKPLSFAQNKRGDAHHRNIISLSLSRHDASIACCCEKGNASNLNESPTSSEEDYRSLWSVHGKQGGASSMLSDHAHGIGIVHFLGGKNFLITGATGFLAKVLIEKILRTNPDVGKIYVLIKAKDNEAAMKRLKNEVVDTELFGRLQEIHGKNYHSFISKKLIPVMGDVREPNIGINAELADKIAEEVDVLINSAANTTFDERYDVAIDINTIGPCRLMSFVQRFQRLKLVLQVSTAYVNGQRQGLILEKPFCLGDTITREKSSSSFLAHQNTVLDVEAEIKLAFDSRKNSDTSASASEEMKKLGLERAKLYGWQDTYVFTKAMGEMVINCMRGEVPVVMIRPSVIESTWKDPFPGWMEGNRMMDPIVLYYGKGQLSGFLADPDGVLDVVPADMVVNATLAAIAKHGSRPEPGIHVYHVASSAMNPLVFKDLSRFLFQHFSSSPCNDSAGRPIHVPPMKLFTSMEQFSSYVETDTLLKSGQVVSTHEKLAQRVKDLHMKSVEQTIYLASIYEPYTFYGGRFDTANTEKLIDEMSEEERVSFYCDVRSIDWTEYITNVHIPGLRKHVLKGRGGTGMSKPLLVGAASV